MFFCSDEEFEQLLNESRTFDMDGYQCGKAELNNEPDYRAWMLAKPQAVQDAFKAMPFERFYTDKATEQMVYRLYGVIENEDGGVWIPCMLSSFRMDKRCYWWHFCRLIVSR